MASIPGSVRVGGFIAPSDTTDTYATHDSLYGRGGLKEVSSTEERDAIPADRRREGMIVYVGGVVQANYQLIGGIDNANWAVLEAGGLTNPMTTAGDIIYGGTDGTPTRLAKGTDGQVLTLASGNPAWAAASGGSTAIDWANPVSVMTTASLTIGRHHVCSGTTADYTVTLPAVSGNAGKLLSVEMSGALTKLVTLDGNASETIDGATTRVMWARETAVLLCDGTQWTKVGGKSIPMVGEMSLISANQLFNAVTQTKINCNTFSGTAFLNDIANKRIKSPRSTMFAIEGKCAYHSTNATAGTNNASIYVDGTNVSEAFAYRAANTGSLPMTSVKFTLSKDSFIELYGYFVGGSFTTSTIYPRSTAFTALSVLEVPQW